MPASWTWKRRTRMPCSPLEYELDVGLSGGGLFATGRLSVCVRLRCVACLDEFETTLSVDRFALQKELDGTGVG